MRRIISVKTCPANSKTAGFKNTFVNADNLLVASELLRLGADQDVARLIARDVHPLGLAQLAGRVSIRTRLEEDKNLLWSYVTAEDFEKTSRTPADLSYLINHLSGLITPAQNLVLLWQDPANKNIQVVLAGNPSRLAHFEKQGVRDKSFSSFKEAEDHLNSLLMGV